MNYSQGYSLKWKQSLFIWASKLAFAGLRRSVSSQFDFQAC